MALLNFIFYFFYGTPSGTVGKTGEAEGRLSGIAAECGFGQARGIVALSVAAREKDDPDLEFRFCSKCEGGLEYCKDHLYTHVHVTKGNKEDHGEEN